MQRKEPKIRKGVRTRWRHRVLTPFRLPLENSPEDVFVYHTVWLGYLPFGLYHWIMADGKDISRSIPSEWASDWSSKDLTVLEQAGFIETTLNWENPDDDCETKTTYKLKTSPRSRNYEVES